MKILKHLLKISIFFLGLLSPSLILAAVDYSVCPLVSTLPEGVYDPAVNLQDVMHQFRDHLNSADKVAASRSASSEALGAAADEAESASNCSLLSARNSKATMRPPSIDDLPLEQQATALEGFAATMVQFSKHLLEYRDLFLQLQSLPENERDFTLVQKKSAEIRALERQGHKKF